jgi:hypothetical protein
LANVEHFRAAPRRLAEIVDRWPDFLNRLVDRRIALDEALAALRAELPGLKTVVEFRRRSA